MGDWNEHEENLTSGKNPKRSTSKSTKYYKDNKAAAERNGLTVVSKSDQWLLNAIRNAIAENFLADRYLNHGGESELSIVWIDEKTNLRCKARIDKQTPGALGDLKTAQASKPDEFEWAIWQRGYHRQAAFYLDGWNCLASQGLCEPAKEFRFVAVNKEVPVLAVAAPLDAVAIDLGRCEKHGRHWRNVEYCTRIGDWPGYANPVTFNVPERYQPDPAERMTFA